MATTGQASNAGNTPGSPQMMQEEKATPSPKCSTHPGQDLCFFCKTCSVPVCLYCKLTSHQPHVTEDITSAVVPAKERVKELEAAAKRQMTVLEHSIKKLSRDEKELARQKQEVTQELNARYDELLRWASRAQAELQEAIEAKAVAAEACLKAEGNRAKDALENLSKLVTRSSKIPDHSPDVLALETDLKASLLKDVDFQHFSQLADVQGQKTFLHLIPDSSILDLGVVRAFMGELDASTKTSSSPSLREQVAQAREGTKELEARLKTTEQNLLQVMQTLQAKHDATEAIAEETKAKMQIAEARLDTVQKRVAFNAWNQTNPLRTPGLGNLVLNHAEVNVGNGYDIVTGVFTAPVAGLYCLQGTIMTYKNQVKKVYAALYVEDTVYGMVVADSQHDLWDQSTVRAVVLMQQGHRACLKNPLDSPADYYTGHGQPYSSFSGFLVQAD